MQNYFSQKEAYIFPILSSKSVDAADIKNRIPPISSFCFFSYIRDVRQGHFLSIIRHYAQRIKASGKERIMRQWLRHILLALPVALFTSGLSSCIYDDDDMAAEPDTAMMISFNITTQSVVSRGPESRGSWGGYEDDREEGVGYDNEISSLWIGIYEDGDVTEPETQIKVAEVRNMFKYGEVTSDDKYSAVQKVKYKYKGQISTEPGTTFPAENKKYTIAVIINTPDIETYATDVLKDLENVKYYPYFTTAKNVTRAPNIPMFGFQKGIDFSEMISGEVYDIGDIYMLRAMAKVSVGVNQTDEESKKWKLQSLKVVNSNDRGFVASEYNQWNKYTSLLDLTTNDAPAGGVGGATFHNFGNSHVEHDIEISLDKVPVFYLTEQCINFNPECRLDITLADGAGKEKKGVIYFHYYENGVAKQQVDIIRNHYYQFTITVTPVILFDVKIDNYIDLPPEDIEIKY